MGYINLDIPPRPVALPCPLALTGNKTVATLFQGRPRAPRLPFLMRKPANGARVNWGSWSNGAAELGQGSIFKFTNPDTKAFRAVFAGSYPPGRAPRFILAKGDRIFWLSVAALRCGWA
ncbi:MAG: hypothetical protein CM1200mP29_00030 [Verrucomicrobiota bacterium]|nr:MAG: hypothetical protein CM1200mP29_00030 [Verrucomicrobiota bacterium]